MISERTQQTRLIVGGALFSAEGKLLLLQNAGTQEWELPGGELEFGEPPEAGLVRCFGECTDLDVAPDRALGAWSTVDRRDVCARGDGGEAGAETVTHTVRIDYTVRLMGALLTVDIDRQRHNAFAWLARAEALERAKTPALRSALERAFEMLTRARSGRGA